MTTLAWLFHEMVLRHGSASMEVTEDDRSRKHGTILECPCGKRWIGRAPWFLGGGF